jgi:hypothetical protein
MNTTNAERKCPWFVSGAARESFRQKFHKRNLSDKATLVNITDLSREVELVGVSPDGQKDLFHSLVGPRVFFVVSRDIRENMTDKVLVTCLTDKDAKVMLSKRLTEGRIADSLTKEEEEQIVSTLRKIDAISHTL